MTDMLKDKRTTRGLRMSSLVGKAADEDDAFWKHETWAEEGSDDDSFSEEEVEPDLFDSDFNDTEDEGGGDDDSDDDDKPRRKDKEQTGTNKYKEPVKIKKAAPQPVTEDDGTYIPPKKKQRTRVIYYENSKREVRDSTKAKTTTTEMEVNERNKIIPKARPIIRHKYTQKELLLDALETENLNRKWIEQRKIVEDERIARDKPNKTQNSDHYVRFLSRRGTYDTITFTDVDSMPAILKYQIKPIVVKNVCVITGLPAKYKDPLTGLPYHNVEAFKELRKKFAKQSSSPRLRR